MKLVVLIVGSREDHEVAPCTAVLPALELLESIAPVPPATEQTHQDQLGLIRGASEVVVELGGMGQTVQR